MKCSRFVSLEASVSCLPLELVPLRTTCSGKWLSNSWAVLLLFEKELLEESQAAVVSRFWPASKPMWRRLRRNIDQLLHILPFCLFSLFIYSIISNVFPSFSQATVCCYAVRSTPVPLGCSFVGVNQNGNRSSRWSSGLWYYRVWRMDTRVPLLATRREGCYLVFNLSGTIKGTYSLIVTPGFHYFYPSALVK